jgi:hypothetical protein
MFDAILGDAERGKDCARNGRRTRFPTAIEDGLALYRQIIQRHYELGGMGSRIPLFPEQ